MAADTDLGESSLSPEHEAALALIHHIFAEQPSMMLAVAKLFDTIQHVADAVQGDQSAGMGQATLTALVLRGPAQLGAAVSGVVQCILPGRSVDDMALDQMQPTGPTQ